MNNLEQIKQAIIARLTSVENCELKRGDDFGDFTQHDKQVMFEDGSQTNVIKQIGGELHYITHTCNIVCAAFESKATTAFTQLGNLSELVKTALMADVDLGGLVDIFYLENYESQGDADDAGYLAEMSFDIVFEYCTDSII